MNIYLVQFKETVNGRFMGLGEFRARSSSGAIRQAAAMLARLEVDACLICATIQIGHP